MSPAPAFICSHQKCPVTRLPTSRPCRSGNTTRIVSMSPLRARSSSSLAPSMPLTCTMCPPDVGSRLRVHGDCHCSGRGIDAFQPLVAQRERASRHEVRALCAEYGTSLARLDARGADEGRAAHEEPAVRHMALTGHERVG